MSTAAAFGRQRWSFRDHLQTGTADTLVEPDIRASADIEFSSADDPRGIRSEWEGDLMIVGVPSETKPGERRVALIPDSVSRLKASGLEVQVQRGAGVPAGFLDAAYEQAGATVVATAEDLYNKSDLIVKVSRPSKSELSLLHEGQSLVAFLAPLGDPEYVKQRGEVTLSFETKSGVSWIFQRAGGVNSRPSFFSLTWPRTLVQCYS